MIEFLGFITVVSFGLALLNFFVKFINKKFINKLGKDKKQFSDIYRKIMKIIIKYHKFFGIVAVISVLTHFFIAFADGRILLFGVISAVLMLALFMLGFYGAYINKNYKGVWLKIHRVTAFLLIASILIHIIFKI